MTDDHLLVCTERAPVTRDMATFTFRAVEPRTFVFNPGQFLTIGLDVDGRRVERCYSISSSPTRPDTLSISVKRVAGGHVSNWLHDNMEPGMTVTASGPLGRFSYRSIPADKYLFISAGSGITPVMSMLRAATDADMPEAGPDIVFIHSARTFDDIPFRAELDQIAVNNPNVTVAFACTRLDAAGEPTTYSDTSFRGHRGRIDAGMLASWCPDIAERVVFLCGPGQFRSRVRTALVAAGGSLTRIHEESYGLKLPPPDTADIDGAMTVDFTRRARRISVGEGTTILAAAAAAGVTLPSTCGVGLCGACKVTKTSGEVVMNHQGGIRPREIAQGKILLCCSEPLTPVVIDF
ncbi:2Fe-2S iron-sulfur cluster binding domain-containing protein [Gordonia amarae]|uniref:2Fe-2S iron-sulfur cluster binding domain-containing protein n=1 Tax=Gordonia amarae TaxID=36821 RepID=A0A857KFV2_9ACTN|nr:hybrid-cluster NAD(P)-dependent oxidoreductase [Gordonia amarae]MCS3877339.1 ferredoxin-NADP reductase [Gordonia amarae]QHN16096.1 2Fe-2S iron-sulfur cluster binding domain-containing protein [Gordonia amarae]QHN20664.1 2Fe-2S iron-sulfur cluster binding domain-containing protein [Gordonia amarae]QHN29516.1 2Fe-2S iron-sulfur cluster binding domain-containing protein [Gordonia amarae]QHN38292.1 2Fe-2S iron-sulfur cluster binding domain-containing protein [Gordonia amarae]